MVNYIKQHAEEIEALLWGTFRPDWLNPDYEAAREFIREVASEQDPEAPSP